MPSAVAEPKTYRLVHRTARAMAVAHVQSAEDGWTVTLRPPRRTDAASDKMHAMCSDLSKQVLWCGARLSTEDWKRVATAMLKKDRFIRDVNDDGQPGNGLIVIGAATCDMSGKQISEVIAWLDWFGAKNAVVWSEAGNVTQMRCG